MARKASALVVDLETAAEMLLSSASFIRGEIKEGALKGIKLGNQWVVRVDELREYLERKEAEGPPAAGRQRKARQAEPAEPATGPGAVEGPRPDGAEVWPQAPVEEST